MKKAGDILKYLEKLKVDVKECHKKATKQVLEIRGRDLNPPDEILKQMDPLQHDMLKRKAQFDMLVHLTEWVKS